MCPGFVIKIPSNETREGGKAIAQKSDGNSNRFSVVATAVCPGRKACLVNGDFSLPPWPLFVSGKKISPIRRSSEQGCTGESAANQSIGSETPETNGSGPVKRSTNSRSVSNFMDFASLS